MVVAENKIINSKLLNKGNKYVNMAALLADYLDQLRDSANPLNLNESDSLIKLNLERIRNKEIDELTIQERTALVGVLLEQLKPLLNVILNG